MWIFSFTNAAYNLVRMRTLIRVGKCVTSATMPGAGAHNAVTRRCVGAHSSIGPGTATSSCARSRCQRDEASYPGVWQFCHTPVEWPTSSSNRTLVETVSFPPHARLEPLRLDVRGAAELATSAEVSSIRLAGCTGKPSGARLDQLVRRPIIAPFTQCHGRHEPSRGPALLPGAQHAAAQR